RNRRDIRGIEGISESIGSSAQQFPGALPDRRSVLPTRQQSERRERIPRGSFGRPGAQVDGSLGAYQSRQDFRHHRSARARSERISPGAAHQGQYLRGPGRGAEVHYSEVREASQFELGGANRGLTSVAGFSKLGS